ncbi:MAG: DUF2889 domain-containing protein [Rhodobacterales bacterium]|nr:DUF2889 domain-containing protein [Rhodobacterales bacterium]
MPLSRPAPRRHIHTRDIRCLGFQRDDGQWDIEARLVDTKTYSFDNQDRGGINAGEPIHEMLLRLTLTDHLEITAVEADIANGPFTLCGSIVGAFQGLVGLSIGRGWRKAVLSRLGGTKGCTHLVELLLGQLAATAYQTVRPARARREQAAAGGGKPSMLDTCHALASDSPVVARHWPDHFTGPKPGAS